MPAGGSSMFTDVDGYQANLRDVMDLLVPKPRLFHARLTWAELSHLGLLRAEEALATRRVCHSSGRTCVRDVSDKTGLTVDLRWRGTPVRRDHVAWL